MQLFVGQRARLRICKRLQARLAVLGTICQVIAAVQAATLAETCGRLCEVVQSCRDGPLRDGSRGPCTERVRVATSAAPLCVSGSPRLCPSLEADATLRVSFPLRHRLTMGRDIPLRVPDRRAAPTRRSRRAAENRADDSAGSGFDCFDLDEAAGLRTSSTTAAPATAAGRSPSRGGDGEPIDDNDVLMADGDVLPLSSSSSRAHSSSGLSHSNSSSSMDYHELLPSGDDADADKELDDMDDSDLSDAAGSAAAAADVLAEAAGATATAAPTAAPPFAPPESPTPASFVPFSSVQELYAYLLLRGQCHITEDAYFIVKAAYNATSRVPLPSANYVRYELATVVRSAWMLPSQSCSARSGKSGGRCTVSFVAPSSHVRRDMMFVQTYQKFEAAGLRSAEERALQPEYIDTPHFQDRSCWTKPGSTISRFELSGAQLCIGDKVEVRLGNRSSLVARVTNAHFSSASRGIAPDQCIHAGDFVASCKIDGADGGGSLVARHWYSAVHFPLSWVPDEERTPVKVLKLTKIPWHGSEGAGLPTGGAAADGDGENVVPSQANVAVRPPSRATHGVKDGMPFLIIALCFNSDDFCAHMGKEISLGGVYMSYLSWLFEDRRSSHAARKIAITPPGVDSDFVLDAITPDLVAGATDGWVCHDPDGTKVRVFADVSIYVGDYLQVVKTSKMMGYGAKSLCTFCAYRTPGTPGSRYGLAGSSVDINMARTSGRTRSVCKAAAAYAPDSSRDEEEE